MAIDLSNISQSKGLQYAPFICLHGTSGVGKTTFGAGAPNPIFIQTEAGEGLLEIDTFRFGEDGIASSYAEVLEAIDALLNNKHDYKTLVIDSIDHLEPLMWAQLCKENGWPNIDKAGYGAGYNAAAAEWRVLLKKLDTLRRRNQMAIVLIAHNQTAKVDEPGQSQIDRWDLKLHKKSAAVVTETVDAVFYAKHQVKMRKEDKGFGNVKSIGVDTGERVLVTQGGPHVNAKNRYALPDELPLSWDGFMDALTQSIKPAKKETANG